MDADVEMLQLAADAALKKTDGRAFRLGAVGMRRDNRMVSASNGPSPYPTPNAHAEARLLLKLTPGSSVWVARVRRDGSLGIARPCGACERRLRAGGVVRVVYTISDNEYGVIDFRKQDEQVRNRRGARPRMTF